jgi:hypothetical protein
MSKGSTECGRKSASEVLKIYGDSKCKCKYCNEQISCKIERIRAHLQKCKARNCQENNRIDEISALFEKSQAIMISVETGKIILKLSLL